MANAIFDFITLIAILVGMLFLLATSRSTLGKHLSNKKGSLISLFFYGFVAMFVSLFISIFLHGLAWAHHLLLAITAILFTFGFKRLLKFINPKV